MAYSGTLLICCVSLSVRFRVQPLKWSPRLTQEAQRWADSCVFEHSPPPERAGRGENLYINADLPAKITGSRATVQWYKEVSDYNWSNGGVYGLGGKQTGHFTQSKFIP